MSIAKVDERGRILLSKEIRKIAQIKPKEHIKIKLLGKGRLILEKISTTKRKVSIPLFGKPIHVPLKKLKKVNLEKIEEEMWSS